MSFEEDVDVYGECRNFIKFCKEQGIQVSSEAIATAGPKLSAYCPVKNDGSPVVVATETVLVDGIVEIL